MTPRAPELKPIHFGHWTAKALQTRRLFLKWDKTSTVGDLFVLVPKINVGDASALQERILTSDLICTSGYVVIDGILQRSTGGPCCFSRPQIHPKKQIPSGGPLDHPWSTRGSSMDRPWIVRRSSTDRPCIIHGSPIHHPRII